MATSATSATSNRRFVVSSTTAFAVGNDFQYASRPQSAPSSSSTRNILCGLTTEILETFLRCNPQFRAVEKLPQRMLTNPSEVILNNGTDNEEANLICRVHDKIQHADESYTILDLLGTGTFGQVFKCQKDGTKELVAIKIIKNKTAYHNQGLLEIKIARLLNNTFDPKDERHLVRLIDSFEFKNHVCLIFELLSMSLLDILTQNQFRGLPLSVVQRFSRQILAALVTLEDANIIHCDLKPENILLSPPKVLQTDKQPVQSQQSAEQVAKKSKVDPEQNGSMSMAKSDNSGATTKATNMTSTVGPDEATAAPPASTNAAAIPPGNADADEPPSLVLTGDGILKKGSFAGDADSTISSVSDPTQAAAGASAGGRPRGSSSSGVGGVTTGGGTGAAVGGKEPAASTEQQRQTGRLGVWSDVKVIDLGSACFEGRTMYSYIQSRFYRSPEVLLGIPYNGAIDMWSLACVCAEMYLGLPLFPGVSQHNQLTRIVEMMGTPPDALIEGKNGGKYFTRIPTMPFHVQGTSSVAQALFQAQATPTRSNLFATQDLSQPPKYRLKTAEEYAAETNTEIPVLRKYLRYTKLEDVIMKCPLSNKSRLSNEQKKDEMLRRLCFLNFLQGLFKLNPFERWTAKQAASHPFIINAPFTGDFVPPPDPKINERKLAYLVLTQQKERMRCANPSMRGGGRTGYMGEPSGGLDDFLPLRKRLSEPVHRQDASSLTHSGKSSAQDSLEDSRRGGNVSGAGDERRPLQRGMSVIERGDGRLVETPSQPSNSMPLFGNNYLHLSLQDQQYMLYQQQVQQRQQQPETSREQYSAYSAATPTGEYLGNYYINHAAPTDSGDRGQSDPRLSTSGMSNSSGGAFKNYMESLGRATSASASASASLSKHYAGTNDLSELQGAGAGAGAGAGIGFSRLTPRGGTAGIRIPAVPNPSVGARTSLGAGGTSYGSGNTGGSGSGSGASSYSITGGPFASPGSTGASHPASALQQQLQLQLQLQQHQQLQQQQLQQLQQHQQQQQQQQGWASTPSQYLGGDPWPGSAPSSGSLSARVRSQGIPISGAHGSTAEHRPAQAPLSSSLTQQLRLRLPMSPSASAGARRDDESPQMFQLSPAQPSSLDGGHRSAGPWTDGRLKAGATSSAVEGSQPSSLGDSYGEYGGSLPGSLTEVPLMMTDFAQALMRPDMDERRRLQSMQPALHPAHPPSLTYALSNSRHQHTLADQQFPGQTHAQTQAQAHAQMQAQMLASAQRALNSNISQRTAPVDLQQQYQQYYQQQRKQQQELHQQQEHVTGSTKADRGDFAYASEAAAGDRTAAPPTGKLGFGGSADSGSASSSSSVPADGAMSGITGSLATPLLSSASFAHSRSPRRLAAEARLDDDDDFGDISTPPNKAQNFSVNLLIRPSVSSSNLRASDKADGLVPSGISPLISPLSQGGGGGGGGGGGVSQTRSTVRSHTDSPLGKSPANLHGRLGPASAPAPGTGTASSSRGAGGPGIASSVTDVADALADWDPFFGAADIEMDGATGVSAGGGGGSRRSAGLEDSMDDVDDSDWRSTGGDTSRGQSAAIESGLQSPEPLSPHDHAAVSTALQ